MNNTYFSEPVLVVLDGLVGGAVNDEPCRLLARIVWENLTGKHARVATSASAVDPGVSAPPGPCKLGCSPFNSSMLVIYVDSTDCQRNPGNCPNMQKAMLNTPTLRSKSSDATRCLLISGAGPPAGMAAGGLHLQSGFTWFTRGVLYPPFHWVIQSGFTWFPRRVLNQPF